MGWNEGATPLSRTIKAGMVGGTASSLGGGKFANGAWTASFQHLVNNEAHKLGKNKKLFALGKDQSKPLDEAMNDLENFVNNAGYDMIRDIKIEELQKYWASGNYDEIIYYNHGHPNGEISYEKIVNNDIFKNQVISYSDSPLKIFDPQAGKVKTLKFICCHYDKVVTEATHNIYKKNNILFQRIPFPQNSDGTIDRLSVFNKQNWPKVFK
jgi:hypothetical protein